MALKASIHSAMLVTASLALAAAGHAQERAHSGDASFETVLAALDRNNMSAEEIRSARSIDRVDVVDLSSLEGNREALEETLRETEDGWAEVQTAIEANEVFERALRSRAVPLDRVVAVTRNDESGVTVYLR